MNDQKREPTAEEIYKLVKDNNRMLHAIRRDAFIGGLFKIVFWIVILVVLPYISWLFIQPYLEGALSAINQVQGSVDTINTAANEVKEATSLFPNFSEILGKLGGGN